jgi:hypothetical protein
MESEPLNTDKLTWAALLGRWVEFARSALALPTDEAGRRLRDSVVDIITLQAVWAALKEIDSLPAEEHSLGLDRAEVLITRHSEALRRRFADAAMPEQIEELMRDATDELARRKVERP